METTITVNLFAIIAIVLLYGVATSLIAMFIADERDVSFLKASIFSAIITPIIPIIVIVFVLWKYVFVKIWSFFELHFFFTFYILGMFFRNKEWKFETRKHDGRDRIIFLNMYANYQQGQAKKGMRKIKAKIRNFAVRKINSFNGFTPREDNNYEFYLIKGFVSQQPIDMMFCGYVELSWVSNVRFKVQNGMVTDVKSTY